MKIQGSCEICSKEITIVTCCSGWGCGCGGGPVDPPVCSDECFDKLVEKAQAEQVEREKQAAIAPKEDKNQFSDPNNTDGLPF